MIIKSIITRLVEKLTGRKCSRCKYNRAGRCCHPNGRMFMKCWHSITRPGWTGRYAKAAPPVYELSVTAGEWDGVLSEEEQHQLQKIKATLQEAGDLARESGLLGEYKTGKKE